MLISTKGRYALRLMLDLAEHRAEGYLSIKEIAARQDISPKYLEAIVAMLTRAGLFHGQIWRLVSFVFVPGLYTSPFWLLVELYFYWWVGNSLTRAWGDFRFTVYWLVGMLGAILSCLITGFGSASGLFLSLFFAYAWMWPEQRVLLFFFLPVKVKWLGWAAAAFWALNFLFSGFSNRITLLFGLAGFLLFFGKELWNWCRDTVVGYKRRKDWEKRWK